MINKPIPKDFVKTYEARQRLSISQNTLKKWLDTGVLKSVRVNRVILIPISEIDKLTRSAQ